MKLELNEFLQEICSWKNLLKKKNEEIESLQKQLTFALKQNEVLENSRLNLVNEVTELNTAVSMLRNSFKKIEIFEEDRKTLSEEKEKLQNSLDYLEKLHDEQMRNMKLELQKLKSVNKEETSKLMSEAQNKASKQIESFKKELDKKENDIQELKHEISKLLKEKDQNILKIKIEYEDKIGKLKQQIPKSKMQPPQGLQIYDVFRQKYTKLERESKDEIFVLKEQIKSYKSQIESLRAKNGSSSLSSVLLNTNKLMNKSVNEVYTQTENFSAQLEETGIEDSDFMVPTKKMHKMQSIVVPQKRKLFNLNDNYYVK